MSICAACAEITPSTRQLVLHPNIESLRASALLCPLCLMILEALEQADLISKAEKYRAHLDSTWQLVNDTSITVSLNGHYTPPDEKAWALVLSCGPLEREDPLDETKTFTASSTWLGVQADESSAAAEAIVTRPLAENPRNDNTLKLMKSWIKTCVDSHEDCQIGYTREEMQFAGPHDNEGARLKEKYDERNYELPTRVIDVSAFDDGVRLVESHSVGGKGCYIALSHVWGKATHFKTEEATYETHLTKIFLQDLPMTFRDAVTITRDLGIQYLWIDSLCIIQDSTSDWTREASRMASVYMNAYVTISATYSVNSNGGCLATRQPPQSTVSLKYNDPSTGTPAGNWFVHNRTTSWTQHVRRSIIASRAWTLQEKQLARRTLHFARDQVSFECKTGLEFETQRPSEKAGPQSVYFQSLYWTLVAFRDRHQPAVNSLVAGLVMRAWSRVVEDYSTRQLTFKKDKLPAIEGLARYVSALTLDQYCFGLWRTQLDVGLLWRTAPQIGFNERKGRLEGLAPTWSWASMDESVYFAFQGAKPLEEGHTTGSAVEIVDVSSDGTLIVNGRMVRLLMGKLGIHGQWDWDQWVNVVKRTTTTGTNPILHGHDYVRSDNHHWFGLAAMDEHEARMENEVQQKEVDALLVTQKRKEGAGSETLENDPFIDSYFVLFLERTMPRGTFRRIGMGQIFLCEGVEEIGKSQISII